MKRLLTFMLGFVLVCQGLIITAYAKPEWPSDTGIQAEGGIVIDMDSGTVLFGQQIKVPYPPASITKLLTALVVLENSQLGDMVTFSEDAIHNVESGSGNALKLDVGDQLTVEDCLYAMLLRSSNQAANALAEHVGGSRDAFVQMMNDRIAALGCTDSHFANPSGLNDSKQYVTSYDMALIAREAFSNAKLMEIDSTLSRKIGPTINYPDGQTVKMEHKLIITTDSDHQLYYPDAKAGKTGYTELAGNTLVTYAERDGRRVIAVVLKGKQPQYYLDTKTLLDFGLDRFKNVKIADEETAYTTGEEPVVIGEKSYAPSELMISGDGVVTLPLNASFADAEKVLETTMPGTCPSNAVARIQYLYNERKIGQAYLCLKETEKEPETGETQEAVVKQPDETKKKGPGGGVIAAVVLFVVLAAAVAGGGYVFYLKKQEERERALRRARRRQRLLEEGCTEEEFDRLLEQRMNSGPKK